MANLNMGIEGELRYIVQWFNEWSELQRDDFLPILSDYLTKDSENGIYMNGIVSGLAASSLDKPMSLFQCRVKLFREWSAKWPEDVKLKLKDKVLEIDPTFGDRLDAELSQVGRGNGAITDDDIAAALTNGNGDIATNGGAHLEQSATVIQTETLVA